MNIITGERIQSLCDVYCGAAYDFSIYNRAITSKNLVLQTIVEPWDNPKKIYCYGDSIDTFISILPHVQNDFIFVSHNSDTNITSKYQDLLNHPKLLFWHAQNVMLNHPKLGGLPIGIANSTWAHGNLNTISNIMANKSQKIYDFYFYFSIDTNRAERKPCHDQLVQKGLIFGKTLRFEPYLATLAAHKYAICPPGNGVDCHRIWECYYLNVIPIVKRSVFTEKLSSILPCVLLDDWSMFNAKILLDSYIEPCISSFDKLTLDYIRYCIDNGYDYFHGSGEDNMGPSTLE